MTTIKLTLALSGIGICLSGIAWSNPSMPCGERASIVDQLVTHHGERQVAFGLADGGQVMELWKGPQGGWTLLATLPNGQSCVVAAGAELHLLTPNVPEPAEKPV
jgi:hypothetical protein